jgi:hypothetical protein
VVRGYQNTPEVHLAMQRGELEGTTASLATIQAIARDWLAFDRAPRADISIRLMAAAGALAPMGCDGHHKEVDCRIEAGQVG